MAERSIHSTIYYDVTRLIQRRNNHFPTGIDRIDFVYCQRFIQDSSINICFVARAKDQIIIIPNKLFREYFDALYSVWFGDQSCIAYNIINKLESGGYTDSCRGNINLSRFASRITRIFNLLKANIQRQFVLRTNFSEHCKSQINNTNSIYYDISHQGLALQENMLSEFLQQTNARAHIYIHDLIPLLYPEYSDSVSVQKFKNYLDNILRKNATLIFNSYSTKKHVEEYARNNNYQLNSNTVEYPDFEALKYKQNIRQSVYDLVEADKQNNKSGYCIIISTIEPRKNHLLLLKIWQKMLDTKQANINLPKLYIVGKRGWNNKKVFDILDNKSSELSQYIRELSNLNDTEVHYLLTHSNKLLFPSFMEGFGLPFWEAMQAHVPIIASNIDVFEELKNTQMRDSITSDSSTSNIQLLCPHDINLWQSIILSE